MALDVRIKIVTVEQERTALTILHNGQPSLPDKATQFPRAEAQIMGRILQANQAALGADFGLIYIGHGLVTPLPKRFIP